VHLPNTINNEEKGLSVQRMMTQLTCRFEQALLLANQLHAQQFRKDGCTPYISHLLSVAALVLEDGGDEDEAIAALLHDAIEDQGGDATRQRISAQFGDRVTTIINGCTDSETMPKPPWEDRKRRYLTQLQHGSSAVYRVSLADKLHNARCLLQDLRAEGIEVWSRFQGGRIGKLWFYGELLTLYQQQGNSAMTQELASIIQVLTHEF
jgi:(p)ppGpp synthase/HD superfamily hydrolase